MYNLQVLIKSKVINSHKHCVLSDREYDILPEISYLINDVFLVIAQSNREQ